MEHFLTFLSNLGKDKCLLYGLLLGCLLRSTRLMQLQYRVGMHQASQQMKSPESCLVDLRVQDEHKVSAKGSYNIM